MKIREIIFPPVIIAFLFLAAGFVAGSIFYPVIFPNEVIPIISDSEVVDPEIVIKLVRERTVLYALIEQQQEMIDVYEKMINGYDRALGILMEIGDY